MEDYTLEFLSKKFGEHEASADICREQALERFKIEYPDSAIPSHLLEEFNLPRALKLMADEIAALRKTIDWIIDECEI